MTPYVTSAVLTAINTCNTNLKNNTNFGTSIPFSTNWYSNLSEVEIVARLIYGENTFDAQDQNAVSWVLINRKVNTNFGGSTYKGVATKSGAFQPITGGTEGATDDARSPSTSSALWSNAVWNACILTTTSSTSDYADLIPKPAGITNQLYFVGLTYFLGVAQNATPVGTGIKYKFSSNSSYVKIKDIVIVFTYTDTLQNPSSISTITSNSQLNEFNEQITHNIFFNEA